MALKGREVSAFASLIVVPMHTIEMASRVVGGLIWQLKDLSALVIDGIQVLQHGTARRVRIEAQLRPVHPLWCTLALSLLLTYMAVGTMRNRTRGDISTEVSWSRGLVDLECSSLLSYHVE